MALDQLPTEIILIIASYLPESGIHALTQTNRHLYNRLINILHYFHGQYKHGAALPFIAERNFFLQVPSILEGLSVARDQPDAPFLAAGWKRKFKEVKQAQEEDEDEEEEEEFVPRRRDGRWDPTDHYWQDIYTHPLYQQGKEHSIPSIVNIQHALVKAIQSGSTETVTLCLILVHSLISTAGIAFNASIHKVLISGGVLWRLTTRPFLLRCSSEIWK